MFRFYSSSFFFFAASYILLPTLPLILSGYGKSPAEVGVIMGAFTAAAVLLRFPTSRLLASASGTQVLRAGHATLTIGFALYFAAPYLGPLLAARLIQGAGLAFFSTAAYLYLDRIGGSARRAELISLYALSANVAMAVGPLFGSLVWRHGGEYALYAFGAALALAGLLLSPRVTEPSAAPRDRSMWEPAALPGSIALFGLALSYGTVMVFVPLAMEAAPQARIGAATALCTAAFDAGIALGAALCGFIAAVAGLRAGFLTIGLLFAAALGALAYPWLVRRLA
jgi:MFS family permease